METWIHRRRALPGHPRWRSRNGDETIRQEVDSASDLGRDQLRPQHRPGEITLKIVVAADLPASALELLRAEVDWTVDARTGRTPADLAAEVSDADALLVRSATRVDARLLDAAARLRIVAR